MPYRDPQTLKEWKQRKALEKYADNMPICETCGNEFIPLSPYGKHRFCSKFCTQVYAGSRSWSNRERKVIDLPSALEIGDVRLDKNLGYTRTYFPSHSEANTWGYVYTHRLVAEKMIGRPLTKDEVVHHKNGKRWDNREENLEVMNKNDHSRLHGQREEDLLI